MNHMTNDVDNPDELTSRVRKFAQERDKQLQRRYQNNNDKNKSTSNEKDSILSSHQGQFTPAIRQFSAPKGMTESYLNEKDIAAERPKFPPKPTIFRAFNASNISIGGDDKDSTQEIFPPQQIVKRNRPPMPAQNRSEMGPPKSRIQRPPSDPTPASYHRTATRDSIDSSRASTLSTNDEDEKSSIDEIGPEHDDDDENDNKNETKESEERNQLRNSHSHVLSTSNDTTVDQRKFQSAMVPELQLDNNKKKIDCRGKRDEDTSLMTPPSSVARPLHIFQGFDLTDMKKFLMSPIPKDAGVVQCYIKRNRIGMNKLYPIYSIYLKTGDRFLMSSRKRPNNKTSNYLISMSEYDLNRVGDNYLGKLRSNFVGTEFQIFDDGVNPKDSEDTLGSTNGGYIGSGQTQQFVNKETRQELGVVIYAPNILGSRGPRKMQVAIPEVDEFNLRKPTRNSRASTTSITTDSQTTTRRSRTSSLASSLARRFSFSTTTDTGTGAVPTDDGSPQGYDDLLSMVKDRCYHDLNYYINKPPRWNEQVGAYVLNFGGRVTMASVKNFQLCDPEELDDVALQFGRVGKEDFNIDLKWPLSPFQAFAITLSSFDSKIACD